MYIIDRFEGDYAICEDENKGMHTMKRCELPEEVKEGDCIRNDGNNQFLIDHEETQKRKDRIKKRMSALFED